MSVFTLSDHPQLPLVLARVQKRARPSDKEGFRLRYSAELGPDAEANADAIIDLLDDAMGIATKGHGTYQAKYDEVRAAFAVLMDAAGPPQGDSDLVELMRPAALMVGVLLAAVMCFVVPTVTVFWLVICALKRQSGLVTMVETNVVASIFDWRPLINRLFAFHNTGKWPK